jgi:hypothetical protein
VPTTMAQEFFKKENKRNKKKEEKGASYLHVTQCKHNTL